MKIDLHVRYCFRPFNQRQHATRWKVAGSFPLEVIGFFNLPNPSGSTMFMELTQSLMEVRTRNLWGGLKISQHGSLTPPPASVSQLSGKCGSLNISQPYGFSRPVTGLALSF
jgi:hypothetical protein